jgi:hypothetical protein
MAQTFYHKLQYTTVQIVTRSSIQNDTVHFRRYPLGPITYSIISVLGFAEVSLIFTGRVWAVRALGSCTSSVQSELRRKNRRSTRL